MNKQPLTDALQEAMLAMTPFTLPEYEYRVYYNPDTMECIYKTITDDEGDNFVTVTREEYDAIEFCPHYVVKAGKLEHKIIDFSARKKLQLSTEGTAAIARYNMFIASPLDTDIEHWAQYD